MYVRNMGQEPDNRLIGYARVSTDDQDLSLQIAALTKYGVREDHIYREHASGGRMDRVQLQRAMRSLFPGDTLVVWKLDRLGRTLTGVIEFVEEMSKQSVNLISLTDNVDTTSAMGRAFFQIALVFAELERALIAERTKAGMAVARSRGARFGQPHKIKDNPKRLAAAREIVERGVETVSAEEALEILNAADPKAKPIKSTATWGRWLKAGCPGADD